MKNGNEKVNKSDFFKMIDYVYSNNPKIKKPNAVLQEGWWSDYQNDLKFMKISILRVIASRMIKNPLFGFIQSFYKELAEIKAEEYENQKKLEILKRRKEAIEQLNNLNKPKLTDGYEKVKSKFTQAQRYAKIYSYIISNSLHRKNNKLISKEEMRVLFNELSLNLKDEDLEGVNNFNTKKISERMRME